MGGVVRNSTFTGHTTYAVFMYVALINCEIWNNTVGVDSDNHANTEVTGNYIHDNGVGVRIERFWNEPGIIFEKNTICHNTIWNIEYMYENAMDLTRNCWCSASKTEIKSKIKDAYVDLSLGVVTVDPSYSECPTIITSLPLDADVLAPLQVYPNPTQGVLNVNRRAMGENFQYALLDQFGTVQKSDVLGTSIDISNLAPGVYMFQVLDDQKKTISLQKIVLL